MSVGATEDQVVVLFKRFCVKVSFITCSYPLRIWYVYNSDYVAFVDLTNHTLSVSSGCRQVNGIFYLQ